MEQLCNAVNEVLLSNQALASRLRSMECMMSSRMSTDTIRTVDTAPCNVHIATEESKEAIEGKPPDSVEFPIRLNDDTDGAPNWPFGHDVWQPAARAFEEQLSRTRVYRHAADRQSWSSFLSDGRSTLAISLSSSLTLGEVSHISVYALPIFVEELSNARCYEVAPLPSGTPTPTHDTGLPSERKAVTDYSEKRIPRRLLWYWRAKAIQTPPDIYPVVFRIPLKTSIEYARLEAYTTGINGISKTAVYLPIVVAKCGNVIQSKGQFCSVFVFSMQHTNRIAVELGAAEPPKSPKLAPDTLLNLQQLQRQFDVGPNWGKDVDLQGYSAHECVALLLRYLLLLPEPIIPCELYDGFCNPPLPVEGNSSEEGIYKKVRHYQYLISELSPPPRDLLLYLLDQCAFLSASNYASPDSAFPMVARFCPAILTSKQYALSSPFKEGNEVELSIVTFLIEHSYAWMYDSDIR